MKGVSISGGDAHVDHQVATYEQALEKVKSYSKTESAYFWDATAEQLREKPAGTRSGKWSKGTGWLFMWADKVIESNYLEKTKPVKTDVSLMEHAVFPNGRAGQHTWTQSRRIAKQKGCMLVTAQEAKDYVNRHGALV